MTVKSIEQILREEVAAIHGASEIEAIRGTEGGHVSYVVTEVPAALSQSEQKQRRNFNADKRALADPDSAALQRRDEFYRTLNRLNRAALCCSGGGIRSATFCLGVIQALAAYDVGKPAPVKHERGASIQAAALGCFHYLSTVSGGGYIGSWLSSWRARADFGTIVKKLTSRPHGPDVEAAELSWLRAYSNYLTPQLGITSADSWAAVAIFVRNLVLNWLIIIPTVCLVLLALKGIAAGGVLITHWGSSPVLAVLAVGILFLICALVFTTRHRPSRRGTGDGPAESAFLRRDLVWAVLSAVALTIFFVSRYFAQWLDADCSGSFAAVSWGDLSPKLTLPLIGAVAGCVIYALAWILAHVLGWAAGSALGDKQRGGDFLCWSASGLIYGAIVGLGAYLFTLLAPYSSVECTPTDEYLHLLVPMILGVPWIMMAQMAAEIVFVGLTCYEDGSDADREWLGRAAGWLAAAAVAWAVTAFLAFAGGYFVQETPFLQQSVDQLRHQKLIDAGALTGLLSGLLTALLGGSSKTPAKGSSDNQAAWVPLVSNIVLAVAGPLFVAFLVVALSVGLDRLLLDAPLIRTLHNGAASQLLWILFWLAIGFVVLFAVGRLASCFVNINRFSLHALYRNRLTRCYLGASNDQRDPDLFSGFDFEDNICIKNLWPPKPDGVTGARPHSLFHVVNIALNVVSTKRLAWQERKAESFTASPLHCGAAYLGFRDSWEYGGKTTDVNNSGLSLGTAMAISGAAVSPNMGYHSSPSIALLLTLFNVRLGWWLGNPGEAGNDTYQFDGPRRAGKLLFEEALGQTTDQNPYVYLSDGGHFENLGLYEMVRRRCRLIVLIDAGCDGEFAFEDLGNAVRKIYIDLGVRITFEGLDKLKNRPSGESLSRTVHDAAARGIVRMVEKTLRWDGAGSKSGETMELGSVSYYAIGTIDYQHADGFGPADHSKGLGNGYILYIKPAYHDTETGAGIRSYATANPDFPHETTTDQWFTESQFESYRSLGLDIANEIFGQEIVLQSADPATKTPKLTLHDALRNMVVYAPAPPPPAPPAPGP